MKFNEKASKLMKRHTNFVWGFLWHRGKYVTLLENDKDILSLYGIAFVKMKVNTCKFMKNTEKQ